jgi:hypothetical protein
MSRSISRDDVLELTSGVEWIKLISTQSNAICDESSKKTISPEHVTEALRVSSVMIMDR